MIPAPSRRASRAIAYCIAQFGIPLVFSTAWVVLFSHSAGSLIYTWEWGAAYLAVLGLIKISDIVETAWKIYKGE